MGCDYPRVIDTMHAMNEPIAIALARAVLRAMEEDEAKRRSGKEPDHSKWIFALLSYNPRENEPPRHGTPSGVEQFRQRTWAPAGNGDPPSRANREHRVMCSSWGSVDRKIKKSLMESKAKSTQEPQPRRIVWDKRPRGRKIINLGSVA